MKVNAFDAKTGEQLWDYDPKVDRREGRRSPAATWSTAASRSGRARSIVGTLDGRLIALDAKTGKVGWSVQTTDPKQPYTITGAPRIVKGKVLIGNGGAEYGVRGYVSAYDAETGKLKSGASTPCPASPATPTNTPGC